MDPGADHRADRAVPPNPALISLLYLLFSLFWLFGADELLTLWSGGAPPSPLDKTLKDLLAIVPGSILLYALLRVHGAVVRRVDQTQALRLERIREQSQRTRDVLENQFRERTAELLTINQTLERQVTARTQVEIALRDSEERFRQLAEHIREVFWVYGIE